MENFGTILVDFGTHVGGFFRLLQNTRFVKHTFCAILSQSTHDTINIILVIIFRNTEFEKYEFADTTFRTHGSLNLRSSQLTNASYEGPPPEHTIR